MAGKVIWDGCNFLSVTEERAKELQAQGKAQIQANDAWEPFTRQLHPSEFPFKTEAASKTYKTRELKAETKAEPKKKAAPKKKTTRKKVGK